MNSEWVAKARDPEARSRVTAEFPEWVQKVKNSELVERAQRLWQFLKSDAASPADVVLVIGALLYLISPIDAVPDFIPIAGFLDDATIAGLVLGYLDRKASLEISETSM
jgi:uncharacterized membrane protein YkvA (DUF1232 family)